MVHARDVKISIWRYILEVTLINFTSVIKQFRLFVTPMIQFLPAVVGNIYSNIWATE